MTAATHTPGPWQARWQDPIDVDDYARIAIETAPDAGDIAGIHHAAIGVDEANARLIAAAPDLLAACRLWDEGFTDGETFDGERFLLWVNANRRAAREAIAKATAPAEERT